MYGGFVGGSTLGDKANEWIKGCKQNYHILLLAPRKLAPETCKLVICDDMYTPLLKYNLIGATTTYQYAPNKAPVFLAKAPHAVVFGTVHTKKYEDNTNLLGRD